MDPFQRALRDMNRAIYAAAKIAQDDKHPEAPTLQRLAFAADEIVERNVRVAKP